MMDQLTLDIGLREDSTFANYHVGKNQVALDCVQAVITGEEHYAFISGSLGAGKTHLLQAACHAVGESGEAAFYLSLQEFQDYSPELFQGLEQLRLVCIDDIEAIAGQAHWEEALMDLFNRMKDAQQGLLFAAHNTPHFIGVQLPDLVSRLNSGMVLQLQSLSDIEMCGILQEKAQARGFQLPTEVASYLLRHGTRNMKGLIDSLNSLDKASLAAHRKLTIPFIKDVLGI